MFLIDGELIRKQLLIENHSVSLIEIDPEIRFDDEDLYTCVKNIVDVTVKQQELSAVSMIMGNHELMIYLAQYFYTRFRHTTEKPALLLLMILVSMTLFLSKASKNAAVFLSFALNVVLEIQAYQKELLPFIHSSDYRGMLFWLCQQDTSLEFDDINQTTLIYEYAPPKITPQWLQQYRSDEQPMEFWFYNAMRGKGLFLILYTPKCRYAKCSGCNLPSLSSSEPVTSPREIYQQADYVLEKSISVAEKASVKEVILSNNGNLFDIKTMPTLSLLYVVNALIESLPKLEKIIIESRIEYLNEHQLKTIQEILSGHDRDVKIEIALGFEIFDDEKRNGYYQKGFYLSALEKQMPLYAKYGISLKFYMMYKAVPEWDTQRSIEDINQAAVYAHELHDRYGVPINMHISPTYVATGTQLEKEYDAGNYVPPGVRDISMLCDALKIFPNVSYYISLNDEGLSSTHIEDGYRDFLDLKQKISYFNVYQKLQHV